MYYFAYGSNMSSRRLQRRINATKIGNGKLLKYQLRFHKIGKKDGTGKCDIYFTNRLSDYIYGVVFEIEGTDKEKLDHIEGKGYGYDSIKISVEMEEGIIQAHTYMATNIDATLRPLDWYKEHVLRGAIENVFDKKYIEMIKSVPTIIDTDCNRKKDELSIYV
jgi:gamma-glutamylcyclotransferase (GGCT)/AIG2-like uncharacterized protein YtfP